MSSINSIVYIVIMVHLMDFIKNKNFQALSRLNILGEERENIMFAGRVQVPLLLLSKGEKFICLF